MAEVIDLNPKLATDILVRLGDDVQALGELRPKDVLAAKAGAGFDGRGSVAVGGARHPDLGAELDPG